MFHNSKGARYVRALLITVLIVLFMVRYAIQQYFSQGRRISMRRTLSYRTSDDGRLLLEEPTLVFRLTPQCERRPAELGVSAGKQVRVELLDDGGHLLDSLTYVVPPIDR